jgi:hypothetical protein
MFKLDNEQNAYVNMSKYHSNNLMMYICIYQSLFYIECSIHAM